MTKQKKEDQVAGLSLKEAVKRLEKYGPNEIERKRELSWPRLLFGQFKSPLIYILFFAGLITLFLKEWTDSIVIFLAVGLNTVLGFIQEFKAEKSLIALKKILVPHARVIRDGKQEKVEASTLVPGDLVVLKTGNKVPADGYLVEDVDLHVNEAILTGESVPVTKRGKDEVYMGTVVVTGRGQMIVTKTGQETKMGKIATKLSQTVEEETPLKKQIGHFSKVLAVIFTVICFIIFIEGLWRGRELLEIFTLSVAVAVAAIPEGLVVSLTVILTLGMQRILKRKGLVRRLLAAETLGSVNVICADKTGTLTEGKMKVVDFTVKDGTKERALMIRSAVLCNNMTNPLEIAMMDWALNQGGSKVDPKMINKTNPRINEIPFSSERKFIAVLVEDSKEKGGEIILSGAPEMVMAISLNEKKELEKWQQKLDHYTDQGYRVVAFAYKKGNLKTLREMFSRLKTGAKKYDGKVDGHYDSLHLKWLGLLLFEDPPRKEVKGALNICRQAGIGLKVITGDYKKTALAILRKLEIVKGELNDSQVVEGWELEKISNEELIKKIDDVVLFARTTPEQKIRIVEALQAKGHTVAMMGDGVNDALALKKSEIGIVVGDASEVAQETADLVLLDSDFKTIVSAVEEGRGIFENIRKVILYLLSDSFTEVILISGSLLLGLPIPLLPAQILWVNLVEDGLPGLALAFEPKDKGLMTEPPRKKGIPILDQEIKVIIFVIGLVTDALLFSTFLIMLRLNLPIEQIRTVIFAGLGIDSLLYVFSCKTLKKNLWEEKIFSNKFLNISVLIGFVLLVGGIYIPFLSTILRTARISINLWLLIFGLGIVNIMGIEFIKWLFLQKRKSDSI